MRFEYFNLIGTFIKVYCLNVKLLCFSHYTYSEILEKKQHLFIISAVTKIHGLDNQLWV